MLAREALAHGGSLVTTAAVQVNELVEARDEKHLVPRVSELEMKQCDQNSQMPTAASKWCVSSDCSGLKCPANSEP
jgi:hypothetical protein